MHGTVWNLPRMSVFGLRTGQAEPHRKTGAERICYVLMRHDGSVLRDVDVSSENTQSESWW
jgi:hypothetical protein